MIIHDVYQLTKEDNEQVLAKTTITSLILFLQANNVDKDTVNELINELQNILQLPATSNDNSLARALFEHSVTLIKSINILAKQNKD